MTRRNSSTRRSWSKLKRHLKRMKLQKPGSLPGQISAPDGAHPTRIRCTAYSREGVHSSWVEHVDRLPSIAAKGKNVWIEVSGLANIPSLTALGERYHIHPLAMEDTVNAQQSPKLDVYGDFLFLTLRLIVNSEPCETEQVSMWLGEHVLISFHEQESPFNELIRERISQRLGRLRHSGVDFLAYAIIDAMVDTNYLVADALVDRIERLDDAVAEKVISNDLVHSIRTLRHDLLITRRSLWPIRDVINQLIRDSHPVIQPETRTFLKDCYDHTIQLIDLVEIYREMCADLRDYYLSMINLRSNEIMKVLTIIATIFIPLSFITGLYGMNFDTRYAWNMPELQWPYGYPFALGLMGLTVLSLLGYFRWKHWV